MNQDSDDRAVRKKSSLRFVFGASAVFALGRLLPGIWVNLVYLFVRSKANLYNAESASVGIISGANGPTSILVAMPVYLFYIVLLAVSVWGFLHFGGFSRQKQQ